MHAGLPGVMDGSFRPASIAMLVTASIITMS
jgi:hypothetical protein